MTVGEKIQFHRKKIGLSQEELGQKMLVSRQTVSLWEMDKTLPTIDNLLRLKEVFEISVDDLLCGADPAEENPEVVKEEQREQAKESYTFQYNTSELTEIFQGMRAPMIKRVVMFTAGCAVLLALLTLADVPGVIIGALLSFALLGIMGHIKTYFAYKKAWDSSRNRILGSTYSYQVFESYFVLTIFRNNEVAVTQKIDFGEIEKVQTLGKYMLLQIAGQTFIIRKATLAPDSSFFSCFHRVSRKAEAKKPGGNLNVISIVLFVLSIATIWGALSGVAALSAINQAMVENMWVFFLFLPIPIASIVFGFYLKKKGYKYKKNVIVGFIVAGLLCVYGSFTFLFANVYSHGDEPILKAEQMLDMDIPDHSRINTQDWTVGSQSLPRGYVFSTSDIYFEDAAVVEFEKKLAGDAKWISDIPNDLIGITSYFCDIEPSDYYIIYNQDTGEFNKLPYESGTYVFINILYNADSNTMKLVEYQIEYTK